MGDRKKPKKYGKMNYLQKEKYVKDELADLGLEGAYYLDDGGRGSQGHGMFDLEESEALLRTHAKNDYDRREALKYGIAAGDKRFKDLNASEGFDSMEKLVNTDRAIAKYGYNVLDHTNMDSSADEAAVSNSLFNKYKDGLIASMKNDVDDEQTNTAITPDEPYEPSPELLKQQGILADWEKGYGPGGNLSPYKSNFQDMAYKSEEASPYRPTTDVDEFTRQYKDGVKDVFQFRPTIA